MKWEPELAKGPGERQVIEEYLKLAPEARESEQAVWNHARLAAMLKDLPARDTLENPS